MLQERSPPPPRSSSRADHQAPREVPHSVGLHLQSCAGWRAWRPPQDAAARGPKSPLPSPSPLSPYHEPPAPRGVHGVAGTNSMGQRPADGHAAEEAPDGANCATRSACPFARSNFAASAHPTCRLCASSTPCSATLSPSLTLARAEPPSDAYLRTCSQRACDRARRARWRGGLGRPRGLRTRQVREDAAGGLYLRPCRCRRAPEATHRHHADQTPREKSAVHGSSTSRRIMATIQPLRSTRSSGAAKKCCTSISRSLDSQPLSE